MFEYFYHTGRESRNPLYKPKGYGSETLHLPLRALYFYPTALDMTVHERNH